LRQSQRQPVILEGELPGEIHKTCASANWIPRALRPPSPNLLFGAGQDRWPLRRLMARDRRMTNRQLASAKAALGISSSAVGLKRSFRCFAVIGQAQEIT